MTSSDQLRVNQPRLQIFNMFAVSLSIDMYETKIINRKKSFKVGGNSPVTIDRLFNPFLNMVRTTFEC